MSATVQPALSTQPDPLGPVFRALADPTRRQILDLLRRGPQTTGGLSDQFPLTRYAVMKHLTVLEEAGLVIVRRSGRERWNHLNAVPLQEVAERWISPYAGRWAQSLLRLKDTIEQTTPTRREEPMPETATALNTVNAQQVELEITINASPAKVYKALTTDIGYWWGPPFGKDKDPNGTAMKDVVVEPVLGGKFYESYGNGQGRIFGIVSRIEENAVVEVRGPMGSALPVDGVMCYELSPSGNGTTLKFSHVMVGPIPAETHEHYGGGWNELLKNRLVAFVERGEKLGIRK